MASKKVFNINDKVFAKIRGYPAWPAMVSGVKADTPSRLRYNVYFYGTGERAECKPEDLCSYEENKFKLGKPNKRKYFTEALLQIEDSSGTLVLPEEEPEVFTTPSNTRTASNVEQDLSVEETENVNEIEKVNESNSESEGKLTIDNISLSKGKKVAASRKSLGISISKGTKRKLSDIKSETSSKKSVPNKSKGSELAKFKESQTRPIVLVETLNDTLIERALDNAKQNSEIADKNALADEKVLETTDNKLSETLITNESSDISLDISKITKSVSKIKDSPSSNSEISSSNSSNIGHVSRSGRKIKPKKYSDYENDTEVPKRSRLNKDNFKSSEKQNNNIDIDNSSEQNSKTKDTASNSETKKSKTSITTSVNINDTAAKEIDQISNEIRGEGNLSPILKEVILEQFSTLETSWKKTTQSKLDCVDMLHTEVDLLDNVYKLRLALRTDHANYQLALDILEQISELQIKPLMLKKHREIVDTISKVTKYVGNPQEWKLNQQDTINHIEKATQIRRKADVVFNKFASLFTIPDGQIFEEFFVKEVEEFFTKTKHLPCDQIYGLTSDNHFN